MPLIGWALVICAVHDWWTLTAFLTLVAANLYLKRGTPEPKKKP